jgi:uncharacterized protein
MAELAQILNQRPAYGPVQLLILQSTAFCNIDCSYCYLPARSDRRRMSLEILAAAVEFLNRENLTSPQTTVVWHAGEPLAVPVSWYRHATAVLAARWRHGWPQQAIQTNAMLIDDEWCGYFRENSIRIGVSLDGPASIHDARRKTRSGAGTHAAAMLGVKALRRAGLDCHVICVVGSQSLDAADQIMDFFLGEGFTQIGFNVEEIEGENTHSTLQREDAVRRFAVFFDRVLERAAAAAFPVSIREADSLRAVLRDPRFGNKRPNAEAYPLDIISISAQGDVSTFSPELAGLSGRSGDPPGFFFGNVMRDRLDDILHGDHFRQIASEIESGVAACRNTCRYFDVCGGGAPANKLAEHGRFDATETMFCRLARQVVTDVTLAHLERDLPRRDAL